MSNVLYCEVCRVLAEDARCPVCGGKKLRAPSGNDPVFLVRKDFLFSGVLEDLLTQNDIPYIKKGLLGAPFLVWGLACREEYNFFVPFGSLEKAAELVGRLAESEESAEGEPSEESDEI